MMQRVSLTKSHIVEVAAQLVREVGASGFHITDLANRAEVGVPTIYYHFTSREQIIAEAQLANYFEMTTGLRDHFTRAVAAIADRDEVAFSEAMRADIEQAWTLGGHGEQVGIMNLLIDVWADARTRQAFKDMLDAQYARWVSVLSDARELGWLDDTYDSGLLVAIFWAASIGQAVIPHRSGLDVDSAAVSDFCLGVLRGHASS